MRQEVNLYQDEFVPKIQWCSFSHAVCFSFLFFFIVAYYSSVVFRSFSELKNENEILLSNDKEFNDVETSGSLMDVIVDKRERLERQVGNLSKEVRSKKAIKRVYESKSNMKAASFYNIFLSISQESNSNLSISEIGIYGGGEEIIINGLSRARSAIPDYLKALKYHPSFADTNFGLLKINYLEKIKLYEFSLLREDDKKNELAPKMDNATKSLAIKEYVGS